MADALDKAIVERMVRALDGALNVPRHFHDDEALKRAAAALLQAAVDPTEAMIVAGAE